MTDKHPKSPFDRFEPTREKSIVQSPKIKEAMEILQGASTLKSSTIKTDLEDIRVKQRIAQDQELLLKGELALYVDTLFFNIIKEFGQCYAQSNSIGCGINSSQNKTFFKNFFESICDLYENNIGVFCNVLDMNIETLEKRIVVLYECEKRIIELVDEKLNIEAFNVLLSKHENEMITDKDSYVERINLYHDLIIAHMKKIFSEQIIYLKRTIRMIKDRPKII